MDSVVRVFLEELAKISINKILNTKWFLNVESGREILSLLLQSENFNKYIDVNIYNNLTIRTISDSVMDVFIDEIYVPLPMSHDIKGVVSLSDLVISFKKNVNIIGLAGQGKSTVLRKILLEELTKGYKFPFFIQLKNLNGMSIITHIECTLKGMGVNATKRQVKDLLNSKKIILLLDGFDEVKSAYRADVFSEIKTIKEQYSCFVVTTSRPGTELCSEPGFKNIIMDMLSKEHVFEITKKINAGNKISERIYFFIEENDVSTILSTPILVTLFNVCYPHFDTPPKKAIDFYYNIFETLIIRHQKIQNVSRELRSGLSMEQLLNVFCCFCYYCVIDEKFDFTYFNMISLFSLSASFCTLQCVSEYIVDDILNVTGLIMQDGFNRYVFLHKSISEFHAALFISKKTHNDMQKMYERVLDISIQSDALDNLIYFLMRLDSGSFNQFFVKEIINRYSVSRKSINAVASELIDETLLDKFVVLNVERDNNGETLISVNRVDEVEVHLVMQIMQVVANGERKRVYPQLTEFDIYGVNLNSIVVLAEKEVEREINDEVHVGMTTILEFAGIKDEMYKYGELIVRDFMGLIDNGRGAGACIMNRL